MRHLKILKIFLISLIVNVLTFTNLFAMSEDYEKKLYWGCYPNSKQYLGAEKADIYCSCTVKTLSKKFTDEEMDKISSSSAQEQLTAFNFASNYCGKMIED